MRILVIGGCGFIGSHVVDALVAQGIATTVIDSRREAYRSPVPGVRYRQAAWDDRDTLARTLAAERFDAVAHLGWTSTPHESNADPVADADRNLIGSLGVLAACAAAGVARIVFASSGGTVYGPTDRLPISETAATDPISSYGIGKLAVEKYLQLYHRNAALGYAALRVSNPYGPRQNPLRSQGVVAVFSRKILAGEAIEIWGDGGNIRDYVHVEDVARAFLIALRSRANGVFNIGSGVGVSLNEVARTIAASCGVVPRITYRERRNVDVPAVVLDTARAASAFDWRPQIGFADGLSGTIGWLRRSQGDRAGG